MPLHEFYLLEAVVRVAREAVVRVAHEAVVRVTTNHGVVRETEMLCGGNHSNEKCIVIDSWRYER